MSSPILHIKDSFFFEVPKSLWRSIRETRDDFPDFWVGLDDEYLKWEAPRFQAKAQENGIDLPGEATMDGYATWAHDHSNVGKPFSAYVQSLDWYQEKVTAMTDAKATAKNKKAEASEVESAKTTVEELTDWFARFEQSQTDARDTSAYSADAPAWSQDKINGYNKALDGKILIPQPLGELRNLHEPSSGFCISKFMIIQLVVAAIMLLVFVRLANRMRKSNRPRGRIWNALESMLVFLRDEVARPAIGAKEGDKYVPLLWTIFLFVLGMNLMGMVPWVGAPTGSFAVTLSLAAVTLLAGIVMGSLKFGLIGFWTNQVPGMDLHPAMGIILKPVLWAIEVLGLFIKHAVLAIRLLANMFAGHIVLLGIMSVAFSLQGALSDYWYVAAPISVIGSTLFSVMELFVAFLQAYIFTFLSALFIGANVHHH